MEGPIHLLIRSERPEDDEAIHALTATAFAPMWFSSGTEQAIVRELRKAGDLTLSLVAEHQGRIVGHVAFSPVTINGAHNGWFALGPISVEPAMQRRGIGKAMIEEGLAKLQALGASGCALIGNPDIYERVSFERDGLLTHEDLEPRFVQRIVFRGSPPRGELQFARAFSTARPE